MDPNVKRGFWFNSKGKNCYLRISKAWEIWLKVEQNPFSSTIQSDSTDEENKKNDKRKCGCEIHDLKCKTDIHGIKALKKIKGR